MTASDSVALRAATPGDVAPVLALQRAYYADEAYPFDQEIARGVLERLIGDRSLGELRVIESGGEIIGYFAVTFGYSLEYRGRDAFLDELCIAPAWRRRGIGRRVLVAVDEICRAAGVRAVHLEAERRHDHLFRLYSAAGYEGGDRRLMTKWFEKTKA